jgi:hypothetical protein
MLAWVLAFTLQCLSVIATLYMVVELFLNLLIVQHHGFYYDIFIEVQNIF